SVSCLLPPLRSEPALFPYTTLFRSFTGSTSNGYHGLRSGIQIPSGDNIKRYANMKVAENDRILWMNAAEVAFLKAEGAVRGWNIDRKSTRLNSSHVKNSYAVFCLKK